MSFSMKGCLKQHAPTGLGDNREHYKRLITFTLDKQICLLLIFFFGENAKIGSLNSKMKLTV